MAFENITSGNQPNKVKLNNTDTTPTTNAQMQSELGKVPDALREVDEAVQPAIGKPSDRIALGGMRNLIINGNFARNQRGFISGASLSSGAYGHDRWKAGGSGATYTYSTSGADTTVTITAGSLQQIIEGGQVEGGTYTLSWSGTAQARVNGGSYAASPITVNSLTAGANITIEFGTGNLTRVQVERGALASPFARRPLAEEVLLCCRYYWLSGTQQKYGWVGVTGDLNRSWTIRFPTVMRAAPTVTTVGAGNTGGGVTWAAEADVAHGVYSAGNSTTAYYITQISVDAEL